MFLVSHKIPMKTHRFTVWTTAKAHSLKQDAVVKVNQTIKEQPKFEYERQTQLHARQYETRLTARSDLGFNRLKKMATFKKHVTEVDAIKETKVAIYVNV